MSLQQIKQQKAQRVEQARAMLAKAETENRSLNADESKAFDSLKGEITDLEAQESRAAFLMETENRMAGNKVSGSADRSFDQLKNEVSVMRVLQAQTEGRALTGAELEYHQEAERRSGQKAKGVLIPYAALETRVNTTATAPEIVPVDYRPQDYIEPLRNQLLARSLGVRVLSGLHGDVVIPKHGSGTTVGWVSENESLTASDMTFDNVKLSPKHVGGLTEMSRQLIMQSSPDIEALVKADLSANIAQAIDSAIINGDGVEQPLGILNTPGVQSASFSYSWDAVLAMLEKLDLVNVTPNAWFTSPKVRTQLRATLREAGLPGYLLEGGRMADVPFYSSNQVPQVDADSGNVILGDFSQILLGIWSDLDILVNPYSEPAYSRGGVMIRAMATVDTAVRHPQAFVIANDAAI